MFLEHKIEERIINYHWSVTESFTGYVLALEESKEKAEAKKGALIEQALRSRQDAAEEIESEDPDQRGEASRQYRLSYATLQDLNQTTIDFIHEERRYPIKNPYGFYTHGANDGTHGSEFKSPVSFANQEIALKPKDITIYTNHHS